MKYMLLIYGNDTEWDRRTEEEKSAIYAEYGAVSQSPGITAGAELQPAATATTVRVQNGEALLPGEQRVVDLERARAEHDRSLHPLRGDADVDVAAVPI